MKYSAAVLERIREPRCAGTLGSGDGNVGTGEAGSLSTGTLIRVQVRVEADRIADARFKAFGCTAAIASASFVAERLQGMPVAEGRALTSRVVIDELALPPERAYVAAIAVEAAHAAIDDVGRATL
jgi:nitrogen fixation protein NifU and related proteins